MLLSGNIKTEKTTGYGNETIYNHIFNLPPTMYGPVTPFGEGILNGNQVITHDNEKTPVYGMLNRSGYIQALVANINAQAGLVLDLSFLTKGLSLSGVMAYQTNSVNQTTTTQNFERYVRSKDFSKLDFSLLGSDSNTPLAYGKSSSFYYNLNLFANVNYSRQFGDHSIDALGYIFYLQQEKENASGSQILPYKRENLGLSATYGYKKRYFVKADLGYSGSEQFHPDNRYVATPAISAAWVVSSEPFMSNLSWLSNLKLRASYGLTANDQLGGERFLYLDYIDINGNEVLPLTMNVLKQGSIVSILIEKRDIPVEVCYQVMKFLKRNSNVSYTDSGNGFIEVCSMHNKKSIIVDELRRRKAKNKIKKILAIGDNDNDIDLFKAADISVAVANSSKKAKKSANYICRKSDADGYLEMLTVIEKAKRLYW